MLFPGGKTEYVPAVRRHRNGLLTFAIITVPRRKYLCGSALVVKSSSRFSKEKVFYRQVINMASESATNALVLHNAMKQPISV
jgi:hypothetical protein